MSEFFKKAKRDDVKIKIALAGPAGSGKTMSALKVARGLVGPKGKIAVCDSEKGSAKLYSNVTDFDHVTMNDPFTVAKYLKSIEEAAKAGYDVLILDTITHEWIQLLKEKELLDSSGKGNKYTNWSTITRKHDDFVAGILQADIHIIATMRSKTAYTMGDDGKGKTSVKKVGLEPIQRDGVDYEFTTVFDMAVNHSAESTKDRTQMFGGKVFIPTEETGQLFAKWLKGGNDE